MHTLEGVMDMDAAYFSRSLLVIVTRKLGKVSRLQLNGNHPKSAIAFQFLSTLAKVLTHTVLTSGIIL